MTADPWVQYFVVRKDHPITMAQGMALAGGGAVLAADRFRADPAWAAAYRAWSVRPRKVALRADEEQMDALRGDLDHVALETTYGPTMLALPPRLRSASEPELVALRPYTDGPRPKEAPPEPGGPALTYVVRPGVLRTTGKAMAQAGHAALMAADRLGARHPAAFAAWREAGTPGDVRVADLPHWAALRESPDTVVVADAGLTQVEPGTETVIGVAPVPNAVVEGLPRL